MIRSGWQLLGLLCLWMALGVSAANADTIVGRASVIDGDTLQINGVVLRILNIDAPEKEDFCTQAVGDIAWPCGQNAAFALIDLIGTSVVSCDTESQDVLGRQLANCHTAGQDLAVQMAEAGWALPADCECDLVQAASARAELAARGLWTPPFW